MTERKREEKMKAIQDAIDQTKQGMYFHIDDVSCDWLIFLLSELERQEKEHTEERTMHKRNFEVLKAERDELKAENEMLLEQTARELEAANRNWREKCDENRKLRDEIEEYGCTASMLEAEMLRLKEQRDHSAQREIERLQNQIAEWVGHYHNENAEKTRYSEQVDFAKQREQKLIEGLRWYADKDNYQQIKRWKGDPASPIDCEMCSECLNSHSEWVERQLAEHEAELIAEYERSLMEEGTGNE